MLKYKSEDCYQVAHSLDFRFRFVLNANLLRHPPWQVKLALSPDFIRPRVVNLETRLFFDNKYVCGKGQ